MSRTFYITCAIDYVNSKPHLGTAYEKILADALARYHRLAGDRVYFLMGNDEHSLNVERAAVKAGQSPAEYTDSMEQAFREVWATLDLSYDGFIRTSEPRHHRAVSEVFKRIYDAGDVYKDLYKGWYCESCESFKPEKDLEDGNCPVHKTKPAWIEEENYFFKLSKYAEPLLQKYREQPDFLIPKSRRNEIIKVIEGGLEDISVSRPGSGWGVPLSIDPEQRVYVWFDALINYITAVGFADPQGGETFDTWWPADLHVIGKDITRFHCIIWPAMLMSAGVPLARQVMGHGWISFKGEKLSKSLGNILEPLEVTKDYGPDPIRYYLLKEVPFERDGDFTWELFIERYNTELANDLGNLVSRSTAMAVKYFDGVLPEPGSELDGDLRQTAERALADYREAFEKHATHEAIQAAWTLIRRANQFIEERAPWQLAKDPAARRELADVMNALYESVRITGILLAPIMPNLCRNIRATINQPVGDEAIQLDHAAWNPGGHRPASRLEKPSPLVPRIQADD